MTDTEPTANYQKQNDSPSGRLEQAPGENLSEQGSSHDCASLPSGEVHRALVPLEQQSGFPAFIHPTWTPTHLDPTRQRFIEARQQFLDIIQQVLQDNAGVINDIVDALCEYDNDLPTDLLSGGKLLVKILKKSYLATKRKKIFQGTVSHLLERLLDPTQQCSLTQKDILDAFEANGCKRSKVTSDHTGQVYVQILAKLQGGAIRNLVIKDPLLLEYIELKIYEIKRSRLLWEVHGR